MPSGMPNNSTPLSVFVDDSDHGIQFHGNWTSVQALSTEISSLMYPDYTDTPWYGTLSLSGMGNHSEITLGFSYIFNGV